MFFQKHLQLQLHMKNNKRGRNTPTIKKQGKNNGK